jgi:hypothetical protein
VFAAPHWAALASPKQEAQMRKKNDITLADVERDLLIAATLVDKYGDEMQPLLDRVEAEYNKLRRPAAVDRIKAMLEEHHAEAGRD